MPRNRQKPERLREAARLRRLREVLGFSQRELAAEFKVAHGAIAAWESGQRTLPGPALKLLELYEAEIGIIPGADGMSRLKTTTVSRSLALSRSAAGLFVGVVGTTLERLLARDRNADAIRTRAQAAIARNFVRTLGELKGLAMKLGQSIAAVDCTLPEAARAEFDVLLSDSRPMAPAVATQVLLEELGEPPGRLFAEWTPMPFAAASIGQVHRARLPGGEEVAVKVQYPAIVDTLLADLRNLGFVERLAAGIFRGQARGEFVAELRERFTEECDYRLEARNQEAFRARWAGRPGVRIPRVVPGLSTGRVLVSEFMTGESFAAFHGRASQREKNRAGARIAQFLLESIFRHHCCIADPHPGNFLFAGGDVVFLDFGCVKHFPAPLVAGWRTLVRALLERRFDLVRRTLGELGWVPDPEHYDFDYTLRVLQQVNAPWLGAEPFRFSPEYDEATWRMGVVENPNKFRTNMPKDWVFANRVMWGLRSMLARLGATADFRSLMLDVLYEPGERRPAPYSAAELALLGLEGCHGGGKSPSRSGLARPVDAGAQA